MKTRHGYISNSSSTSFLIVYENIDSFEQFNEDKGYNSLMWHVKEKASEDQITEFFNELISNYVYDYSGACFCKKHPEYKHYCPVVVNIIATLKKFKVGDDTVKFAGDMLNLIELKVDELAKENRFEEYEVVDHFDDMIKILVIQIVNAVMTQWKNVSLFEMSDHTDYEYYLEQKFFPNVVANGNGEYAGAEINHH